MVAANVIADLCIYILTWNVADKQPKDIDLSKALAFNNTACQSKLSNDWTVKGADMYVIGFQEVSSTSWTQWVTSGADHWTLAFHEQLSAKGYVKLSGEKMQGIVINLWTLPDHYPYLKSVESQYTRTGFGGYYGNKGAVSLRMSLYGAGVSFVVAHLAAHDAKLQERINDYNSIVDRHHYKSRKYRRIFDHDVVFWFGDLNFRLNGDDSTEEIQDDIKTGRLRQLLDLDQLSRVRASGQAFGLLNEWTPDFPPTFKFIPGTRNYNSQRRPAWCDRILWRLQSFDDAEMALQLNQLNYLSHPEYLISDHKPVSAEFRFTILSKSKITSQVLHLMTHGHGEEVRIHHRAMLLLSLLCLVVNALFSRYRLH